jgi:hypothetical protein
MIFYIYFISIKKNSIMEKMFFRRLIVKISVLPLLLILVVSLNAQAVQAEKDSIKFDKLEHDYGTIERGADGTSEFIFTNKGKNPLVLNNVRATCGCTVPEWPREPIAPGEKGVIKVRYNTNIAGTFNKSVTVLSNAANKMVVLRIKGKVDAKK